MEIRQIELEDIPSVYTLGRQAFLVEKGEASFVYSYWSLQQLGQMYEEYPELSLVAIDEDTGHLMGFILGHPTYENIVSVGYLEWIAVDQQYRGKGVSSHLVAALLAIFKERGLEKIVTDVKGVNEISMNLFQKFGFEVKESVSFLLKEL